MDHDAIEKIIHFWVVTASSLHILIQQPGLFFLSQIFFSDTTFLFLFALFTLSGPDVHQETQKVPLDVHI